MIVTPHGDCAALCAAMSSTFAIACEEIDLVSPLIIAGFVTTCCRRHLNEDRSRGSKPEQPETNMANAPTAGDRSSADDTDKQDVLNEIGTKWSKFSKQELSTLKSNDELVGQIVAKYGIEKGTAQSQVDALMNGRNLTA
jgi:hypothetical protein